jgi:7-cyano-7-deazaguanine synthase
MKVVVILSGGMDSTVLLHSYKKHASEVRALSINYGQRHMRELYFAEAQAAKAKVPWAVADLSSLRHILPGSSQTDSNVPVPHGHYAAETMKLTVVPNRNMILLSVAIGHAIAHKMDAVAYAAHAGDHAIYPDCRIEFVNAMQEAASLCDWRNVMLHSPYVDLTKAQIVSIGSELGVDFAQTYSCYQGNEIHCGKCGTCVERREAFSLAGVVDPTVYQKSGEPD